MNKYIVYVHISPPIHISPIHIAKWMLHIICRSTFFWTLSIVENQEEEIVNFIWISDTMYEMCFVVVSAAPPPPLVPPPSIDVVMFVWMNNKVNMFYIEFDTIAICCWMVSPTCNVCMELWLVSFGFDLFSSLLSWCPSVALTWSYFPNNISWITSKRYILKISKQLYGLLWQD